MTTSLYADLRRQPTTWQEVLFSTRTFWRVAEKNNTEEEANEWAIEYYRFFDEAEKFWRESDFETKKEIKNFISKFPEFCHKKRLEYLKNIETATKEDFFSDKIKIEEAVKKIKKITAEREGRGITDEMIAQAKKYPINKIIKTNNQGFAICPFHADTNPSAYTRRNYFFCFACGTHADTIKLYMTINNVNFLTAVKALQK